MTQKEAEQKAKRVKTLRNQQDAIQAEIDQLEADLKQDMESRGIEELLAGPFKIIWKMIYTSRLDARKLKNDDPALYDRYTVYSNYRKFSIV